MRVEPGNYMLWSVTVYKKKFQSMQFWLLEQFRIKDNIIQCKYRDRKELLLLRTHIIRWYEHYKIHHVSPYTGNLQWCTVNCDI
jgi:hypothetical protein